MALAPGSAVWCLRSLACRTRSRSGTPQSTRKARSLPLATGSALSSFRPCRMVCCPIKCQSGNAAEKTYERPNLRRQYLHGSGIILLQPLSVTINTKRDENADDCRADDQRASKVSDQRADIHFELGVSKKNCRTSAVSHARSALRCDALVSPSFVEVGHRGYGLKQRPRLARPPAAMV